MRKTKKALASLAIAGMALTMVPFNAFANSAVPTRLGGTTAEQTAVQIADQTGYTGTAILASSASYGASDALTAGPLAAYLKAPILLQGPGATLNADTKAELTKLNITKVYVTSGTAVISQAVLDQLKGMKIEVVSLGGADRFETSVNIAKKLVELGAPVNKVAVAYGWLNQDALSIASVASAANEPIILTEKAGLSASAKAFLAANLGITAADVIGGTGVIDASVLAQLPSPTRHFGNTAYDTNNQVIQDFASSLKFDNVFVANGKTGIDALAGAPLAAQTNSAVVLTDGASVPAAAAFTYSKSSAGSVVTALGGAAVVPESIRTGVAAGQVTTAPGSLAIVSVSALDTTNKFLKIQFSKAVTALEPSNIVIKDAKKGDVFGVNVVTLSQDRKTATLELFENTELDQVLSENVEYTVTVNVDGQVLTSVFLDSAFTEARVYDVNVADKEVKATNDKTGKSVTLTVPTGTKFDYEAALGEIVQIWYNDDNEIMKYQIADPTAKYDAIEITKADEIKLLTEGKKYDTSDDTYNGVNGNGNAKFDFIVNGNTSSTTMSAVGTKYNFAKVGYDKSGNVEYVSAYNLSQFLIVDSVDGDEVVGIEGEGTGGSFDAKDATIIKDGKVIALSDLSKGDILYFSDTADGDKGFAEVYSNTVTGAIDDVYNKSITVDGKTYDYVYGDALDNFNTSYAASAVYIDKDGKTALVDSDAAEELQAAGDVTLNFDRAGHLVYIAGDTANVASNTQTGILTGKIQVDSTFGKQKVQISAVLENGDEKVYDITLEDLDTITINGNDYDIDSTPGTDGNKYNPTITTSGAITYLTLVSGTGPSKLGNPAGIDLTSAEGKLMNFKLDDNGNVKELEFFTTLNTAKGGFSNMTQAVLESNKGYVDGKKLLSSALVFDANKGYDDSSNLTDIKAGDVTVTKWSDYKGTDISDADYIFNEDNEVTAIAIRATTSTDTSYEEAVLTSVLENTDGDVVKITAYVNGALKTYNVDEVGVNVVKGDAVVLEIDDNNSNLVTDIINNGAGQGDRVLSLVIDTATTGSGINVGSREITFTTLIGTAGKVGKLVSNGAVLDATDTSDIEVKTLADLRGKTNVTVVLDERLGTTFIKFIIFK